MTPKEKAEELFDRLLSIPNYNPKSNLGRAYNYTEAKKCALITVQECIDATSKGYGDYLRIQYWLNVEKEIEKL